MITFQKYLIRQLSIAVVLAVISYAIPAHYGASYQTQAWPWLLLLFVGVNSLLFFLNQRAQKKKMSTYANYFMLASSLKLILYLAVIVVYLLYFREETIPFLITIFVYYLAFTLSEIYGQMKKKPNASTN